MKKFTIFLLTGLILAQPLVSRALATTLEISGNGSDSVSQIESSQSDQVTVEQNNDVQVENEIKVDADTGNNQADSNTGEEVEVTTGDISLSENVSNDVGHNQAEVENCCQQETVVIIADNGTGSHNIVTTTQNQIVNLNQHNQVNINNHSNLSANTGNNQANSNTLSQVNLTTGNITHQGKISNQGAVNVHYLSFGTPELIVNLYKNGADTKNQVNANFISDIRVNATNDIRLNNYEKDRFNTGGNSANANTGSIVSLLTGDIFSFKSILNRLGINIGKIDTCCQDDDNPQPTPTPKPSPTPKPDDGDNGGDNGDDDNGDDNGDDDDNGNGDDNKDNGSGGDSGSNGDSGRGGQILGAMLPETGGSLAFLLANGILMLSGITLRTRAWRLFAYDYSLKVSFSLS